MRILIKDHDSKLEKEYPGISLQSIEITECRSWWKYDMDRPLLMCTTYNNKHLYFYVGNSDRVINLVETIFDCGVLDLRDYQIKNEFGRNYYDERNLS